jgi:hypothetical protein
VSETYERLTDTHRYSDTAPFIVSNCQ